MIGGGGGAAAAGAGAAAVAGVVLVVSFFLSVFGFCEFSDFSAACSGFVSAGSSALFSASFVFFGGCSSSSSTTRAAFTSSIVGSEPFSLSFDVSLDSCIRVDNEFGGKEG